MVPLTKSTPPHWCFVVPRFGEQIAGGAETLVRELSKALVSRGDKVTVLTTCAVDNRTWENALDPGRETLEGIEVQRFLVRNRDLNKWAPHQIALHEGMSLSLEEQFEWLEHGVNSDELYLHLAQFGDSYDLIFFAPYLFATTFWGSLINPSRSVLIPCLHDEVYAYVPCIQSMFRQVAGCLFNSREEQLLAERLYGRLKGDVVGMGFDATSIAVAEDPSVEKKTQHPYLLYLGRKETGKGVQDLIDYFIAAKDSEALPGDLQLMIAGGGDFADLDRPEALERSDIIDCSRLSEAEKQSLLKNALALIQPSVNESFSIVLMESWLHSRPVIVNADCPVTRAHCRESSGGLYYCDAKEFAHIARMLSEDSELAERLGKSGRKYVERSYSWQEVLSRFDTAVKKIGAPRNQSSQKLDASYDLKL